MTYLGAFRIDQWGQRDISFDPTGDGGAGSLWLTGHDWYDAILEIGIPEPTLVPWDQAPKAPVLTAWRGMIPGRRAGD